MKTVDTKLVFLNRSFKLLSKCFFSLLLIFSYSLAGEGLTAFFNLEDEILINPNSSDPPLGSCSIVTINEAGKIFLGFFPSQRIIRFDKNGNFERTYTSKDIMGKSRIETLPLNMRFNEIFNELVIADFFNLRVLFFDMNGDLANSFVANAENLRNVTDVAIFHDKVIVGGPAVVYTNSNPLEWNAYYLHLFNKNGKYLKSIFRPYPSMLKNNRSRNNAIVVSNYNGYLVCMQTCSPQITIFNSDFDVTSQFGTQPPGWKAVSYSEPPTPEELENNTKHSRAEDLYTINERIVYSYTTVDHKTWQHLDYPRLCIYSLEGGKIADGIPVDYGYNPEDFFCTTFGVNSTQDRLLIVKRENPDDEDSNIIVGIFKPKWGEK